MTNDVLISTDVRVGRIALNRPKAIHALTLGMCRAMTAALREWRADDAVPAILIEGAGRISREMTAASQA